MQRLKGLFVLLGKVSLQGESVISDHSPNEKINRKLPSKGEFFT